MAHLSLVSGISSARIEPVARRGTDEISRAARSAHRGDDVAEISTLAREAARVDSRPIRAELVQEVRRQIEAGTYLTTDKLDAAADRMVARELDITA